MIEYRWEIVELLRADEAGREGVVTQVRFAIEGTDAAGRTERVAGCLTPPLPEDGAEFTDFANLTEAQVIGWLEAMPIADELRREVARRFTDTAGPIAAPLPWQD